MSFDFIPRSVKKRRIESQASASLSTDDTNLGPAQQEAHRPTNTKNIIAQSITKQAYVSSSSTAVVKLKDSPGPDLEQLAALVWLSLSDYATWADVDLRRKIDWSSDVQSHKEREQDDTANEGRGYIPLAYLFQHSPVFVQASSSASFLHHPETTYVKALRTHAAQLIDVRLVLSSEESVFGHEATRKWSSSSGTQTGYEVRIKPHTTADGKGSNLNEYGKADWDRLTVYVENIPIQYRSLPGTMKFITTLYPSAPSPEARYSKIQHITFPLHHRDQSNSIPTCKGFALVTLSSLQDVNFLLEKWPWDTASEKPYPKEQEVDASYAHTLHEAVKFGFRSITKERWEGLKAEYLLFRQQLVEEMNEFQEKERSIWRHTQGTSAKPGPRIERAMAPSETDQTPSQAAPRGASLIHATSSYPSGCLVFVRNLHPETNKTTLRALFSQAWKGINGKSRSSKSDDGIDYLDYMKGMDSCHIRLSTPLHAEQLVEYFSTHPTVQSSGLDGTGSPLEPAQTSLKPIAPELVLGKREEVYWEKVPEKIRKQAVEKALKLMRDGIEGEEKDADHGKMAIGAASRHKKGRGR